MPYRPPRALPYPPRDALGGGLLTCTWELGLAQPLTQRVDVGALREAALAGMAETLAKQGYDNLNPPGFYEDFAVTLTPTSEGAALRLRFRVGRCNDDMAFTSRCVRAVHQRHGPITAIQGLPPQDWGPWFAL